MSESNLIIQVSVPVHRVFTRTSTASRVMSWIVKVTICVSENVTHYTCRITGACISDTYLILPVEVQCVFTHTHSPITMNEI